MKSPSEGSTKVTKGYLGRLCITISKKKIMYTFEKPRLPELLLDRLTTLQNMLATVCYTLQPFCHGYPVEKKTDIYLEKAWLPGLPGVCLLVSKFIFGSQGCQTGWVEKNGHEFRKTKVARVARSLPACFSVYIW